LIAVDDEETPKKPSIIETNGKPLEIQKLIWRRASLNVLVANPVLTFFSLNLGPLTSFQLLIKQGLVFGWQYFLQLKLPCESFRKRQSHVEITCINFAGLLKFICCKLGT
jgi:hypothetical protein